MALSQQLQDSALRGIMRVMARIEKWESGVSFNPLDPRLLDNPYPSYHALREKDPVHRSRVGPWVISRYDYAMEIFQDKRMSNDLRKGALWPRTRKLQLKAGRTQEELDNPDMLHSDPPRHTRLRGLVNQAFTPGSLAGLAPRVEQITNDLLDAAVKKDPIDLITGVAHPLPVIVIAEMLGISPEDRDQFRVWSEQILRGYKYPNLMDLKAALKAEREYQAYLTKIIERRRVDPQDDLITRLVQAEQAGDRLSLHELFSICTLLLVGGNETTANLIGNGLHALLKHPEQLHLLRDRPELGPSAVEELLRYDGPIVVDGRYATEACDFHGKAIKPGHILLLLVGAINRDPERFESPDTLDIARENNRHLAFGHGIHHCLGAALTRLETSIVLRVILERYPNLRLGNHPITRMAGNWGLRGLVSLPVHIS